MLIYVEISSQVMTKDEVWPKLRIKFPIYGHITYIPYITQTLYTWLIFLLWIWYIHQKKIWNLMISFLSTPFHVSEESNIKLSLGNPDTEQWPNHLTRPWIIWIFRWAQQQEMREKFKDINFINTLFFNDSYSIPILGGK